MKPLTLLITGAGSGIGLETLKLAQKAGHHVIAAVHLKEDAKYLPKGTPWRAGDLTKPSVRNALIKDFAKTVDVVVLNAGHGESGPLIEQPEARIRKLFEVNVMSTVLLAQGFGQAMAKRRHGRLVFVTSMAGFITVPNLGAYSATKHALEAMADALRMELKPFNVSVASVEPGLIYTGFNERMSASKFEWLSKKSLFAPLMPLWKTRARTLPSRSYPVSTAAHTLFKVATTRSPRAHNPTPWIYSPLNRLLKTLPTSWQDALLRNGGM